MKGDMEGEQKTQLVQGPDLFRRKERAIKRFAKSRIEGLTNKRKWQQNDVGDDECFSWNEIVDVYSTRNTDITLIEEFSSCCSPIPHACSKPTKLYSVNSSLSGLFFLSSALCESQQVFWATKALEVYSTVEHTNLTNLSRLYDEEDPTVGDKPKSMEELECDIHQLWQKSVLEKRNYSAFDKLRWSCLGYHYGKGTYCLLRIYSLSYLQIGRKGVTKRISSRIFHMSWLVYARPLLRKYLANLYLKQVREDWVFSGISG